MAAASAVLATIPPLAAWAGGSGLAAHSLAPVAAAVTLAVTPVLVILNLVALTRSNVRSSRLVLAMVLTATCALCAAMILSPATASGLATQLGQLITDMRATVGL